MKERLLKRFGWIALVTIVVPCLATGPAAADEFDPDKVPQGAFQDDWYVLEITGERAGWAHSTMTRKADRIHTALKMHMTIKRAGQELTVETIQRTEADIAGQPSSFETRNKLGAMETVISGTIDQGKVSVQGKQMGATIDQRVDYPADTVMVWGAYLEQRRHGLDPGTEYTVKMYEPSMRIDGAIEMDVTVVGPEEIEVDDKTVEAVRIEQTVSFRGMPFNTIAWLDRDHNMLKSTIPMPGIGNLTLVRTDELTARAAADGGAEMLLDTLIAVDKPIDRKQAGAIRYRLTFTGPKDRDPPRIPQTGMQRPGKWSGRAMELNVARIDRSKLRQVEKVVPSDALSKYIEPNLWINGEDEAVVRMAREGAAGASKPYEICYRLCEYVSKSIEDKNLSVGFATASEVARKRAGDCSEHAVLLAALGRAHGIPSRVATGLVYVPVFGRNDNVFGFHMWTQFHIGGEWVDFDAAQRETDTNPTHITFATSSMADSSMAELVFPLLGVMGQIQIEVLEVQPRSSLR